MDELRTKDDPSGNLRLQIMSLFEEKTINLGDKLVELKKRSILESLDPCAIFKACCDECLADYAKMEQVAQNFENKTFHRKNYPAFTLFDNFMNIWAESLIKTAFDVGQKQKLFGMASDSTQIKGRTLKKGRKKIYTIISKKPSFDIECIDNFRATTSKGKIIWITYFYENSFPNETKDLPILEPVECGYEETAYISKFVEPLQVLVSSRSLTANQISILYWKIHELINSVSRSSPELQKCLTRCENEIVVVRDRNISDSENLLDSGSNYSLKFIPYDHYKKNGRRCCRTPSGLGFGASAGIPPERLCGKENGWCVQSMYFILGYYLQVMLQMATQTKFKSGLIPFVDTLMADDPTLRAKSFDESLTKDEIQKMIDEILSKK